tara:strand:+ start:120 stop:1670 length:1551 start_codon:yes stop_codon:yes gene_type:complete
LRIHYLSGVDTERPRVVVSDGQGALMDATFSVAIVHSVQSGALRVGRVLVAETFFLRTTDSEVALFVVRARLNGAFRVPERDPMSLALKRVALPVDLKRAPLQTLYHKMNDLLYRPCWTVRGVVVGVEPMAVVGHGAHARCRVLLADTDGNRMVLTAFDAQCRVLRPLKLAHIVSVSRCHVREPYDARVSCVDAVCRDDTQLRVHATRLDSSLSLCHADLFTVARVRRVLFSGHRRYIFLVTRLGRGGTRDVALSTCRLHVVLPDDTFDVVEERDDAASQRRALTSVRAGSTLRFLATADHETIDQTIDSRTVAIVRDASCEERVNAASEGATRVALPARSAPETLPLTELSELHRLEEGRVAWASCTVQSVFPGAAGYSLDARCGVPGKVNQKRKTPDDDPTPSAASVNAALRVRKWSFGVSVLSAAGGADVLCAHAAGVRIFRRDRPVAGWQLPHGVHALVSGTRFTLMFTRQRGRVLCVDASVFEPCAVGKALLLDICARMEGLEQPHRPVSA